MKLSELLDKIDLTIINKGDNFDVEITGGYTSDLLSDVMGNIDSGMLWITLQVHRNIIAVASLKEIVAVVLIGESELDEDTLEQARTEGITILATEKSAFETTGLLYNILK